MYPSGLSRGVFFFTLSHKDFLMADNQRQSNSGTSILLRLSPEHASTVRQVAKKEERTITTIIVRALREYFKAHHDIDIPT
jgi:hypothetical protein